MAFFVFQVHIHGRLVLNQPHCMGSSFVALGYHLLCPIHIFPSGRCASGADGSIIRDNKQQSRSVFYRIQGLYQLRERRGNGIGPHHYTQGRPNEGI